MLSNNVTLLYLHINFRFKSNKECKEEESLYMKKSRNTFLGNTVSCTYIHKGFTWSYDGI